MGFLFTRRSTPPSEPAALTGAALFIRMDAFGSASNPINAACHEPECNEWFMERAMGFEPTIFGLGSQHSTAELCPHLARTTRPP